MSLLRRWRWVRLGRLRRQLAERGGLDARMHRALNAELSAPSARVDGAALLAIDLEMTGLDPDRDTIISIGWVGIDDGALCLTSGDEIGLDPGEGRVGQSATIHGLRDCDLGDGLNPAEAAARLMQALTGRIAVFHHAPLDIGFLDRLLRRHFGFGWVWPWIDTLDWYRRRQLSRHNEAAAASTRLDAVRDHYGLDVRDAHNAHDDAVSCAEVALILAARSRARLIDVCRLPSARRVRAG
ncbi:MAG: 3'-5' exonuclease [Wenzhouxiangellaceae bacterium]|nr:3'-5' exonuclease [Wenzhouxiangellaceae bacterium]